MIDAVKIGWFVQEQSAQQGYLSTIMYFQAALLHLVLWI